MPRNLSTVKRVWICEDKRTLLALRYSIKSISSKSVISVNFLVSIVVCFLVIVSEKIIILISER
jgi:hypothetical protein